jgi:maltooligosyltrehalose trehalohydrolase
VWAPAARRVEVRLVDGDRLEPLVAAERGYHVGVLDGVGPGSRYLLRLDGGPERPDPASRLQPEGVHGPSAVVAPPATPIAAGWEGHPLEELVFYEIHVGTFSEAGTLDGAVPHLAALEELGVTAVELMPIAQFPGERNWGYDGVQPYAVQLSYGGPEALRRFAEAAHAAGLSVFLDVVYNHLGPEGNYLGEFGPYFDDGYRTPWGRALNFDGPESDEVRRYFAENALEWLTDHGLDGLRLDAIHGIIDTSARPFLAELAEAVEARARQLGRPLHVVSESDLNASRVVRPREQGGYGHAAQWCDDFHHALHTMLTGERRGYYTDYGNLEQLARALREGYVFQGERSDYRRRRHGDSTAGLPGSAFVVCAQNHDQIGNRMLGDRLAAALSPEQLRLAAATVLLSPFLPLLFMGEEYGETAPFPYFVSHQDPGLLEAVREGRRREFSGFDWQGQPPDPGAPATFASARLRRGLAERSPHRELLAWHRELLRLRRQIPALSRPDRRNLEVRALPAERAIALRRGAAPGEVLVLLGFGAAPCELELEAAPGAWRRLLDSADPRWGGSGTITPDPLVSDGRLRLSLAPLAVTVLERVPE